MTSSLSDQSQLSPDLVMNRPRRASMYDALDFTKIDASLYQQRPPLLSSLKTAAFHGSSQVHEENLGSVPEENLGSIQFSLEYDMDTSILTLELIQASDLSFPDPVDTLPNPYVVVRLLPDIINQLQTHTHRQTRCAYLDERFIFDVAWSELGSRCLEMKIYDDSDDESRRDECMGQISLSLGQLDLTTKCVLWKGISADDKQMLHVGDVMFSLSYLPSAERLTVVVVEARNLRLPITNASGLNNSTTNTHLSNVYVKASLFVSGKKMKKKKTSTWTPRPGVTNAIWNEALTFTSLSRQQLETSAKLELSVHHGNHGDAVSKVTVGPGNDIAEEELKHWTDMLNGRPAVAKWHELKPLTITSHHQQQRDN